MATAPRGLVLALLVLSGCSFWRTNEREPQPPPVESVPERPQDGTVAATNVASAVTHVAPVATRITAGNTYYDRKEGFASFSNGVFVDDPEYKLHADRAFVFTGETNDLKRIVAIGHVAITNATRRAYGAKATYFRSSGTVVLTSGNGIAAEVRDVGPNGDQILRGRKIRFWTGSRQVEVLEAEITAPTKAALQGM